MDREDFCALFYRIFFVDNLECGLMIFNSLQGKLWVSIAHLLRVCCLTPDPSPKLSQGVGSMTLTIYHHDSYRDYEEMLQGHNA